MKFESIEIENFRSYYSRQSIVIEEGFNLVVGANNSGKTTIFHLLDLPLGLDDRHRSRRSIPEFEGANLEFSRFRVELTTTAKELHQIAGHGNLIIPSPTSDMDSVGRSYVNGDPINIRLVSGGPHETSLTLEWVGIGSVQIGQSEASHIESATFSPALTIPQITQEHGWTCAANIIDLVKQRVYRFNAERRPSASCHFASPMLDRDGSNLPHRLNALQTSDSEGHARLCRQLNSIFPEVAWMQSESAGGNFTIYCLPEAPQERRSDLKRPLSAMGTGIGNVLCMLYVVQATRTPQVIVIDEPNAFLHPRALRQLLAILQQDPTGHQFIITAHSPDVLTAIRAPAITLLRLEAGETRASRIASNDFAEASADLANLGIRMTDLHSRDRVLWVEGQTEELVLPELLQWKFEMLAATTAVIRLGHTGTLDRRGVDEIEVLNTYERLSQSSSLVPPLLQILLDRESRDERRIRELADRSRGRIAFLRQRMLEDYAIDSQAIHAVLQEAGEDTLTEAQVVDEIARLRALGEAGEHAGKLLHELFLVLTESRHEFRKTHHTPRLFRWLRDHKPEVLQPLIEELQEIFMRSGLLADDRRR